MKYFVVIIISLFMSSAGAGEIQRLWCKSGPGMYAKYWHTKAAHTLKVHFKRQHGSPNNVQAGSCILPAGQEWSNKLYFSKNNTRKSLIGLHMSPTSITIDYQKMRSMGSGFGLDPKIESMMQLLQRNKKFYVSAVHKKIGGTVGWVWVVKSIGY